jgi:hypothetical protein
MQIVKLHRRKLAHTISQVAQSRGYSGERAAEIERIVDGIFAELYACSITVQVDIAADDLTAELDRAMREAVRQAMVHSAQVFADALPDLCYPVRCV